MIKILRQGTKRVAECSICGCLFEYEKEDVRCAKVGMNEYKYYVDCPCCRSAIPTTYFE